MRVHLHTVCWNDIDMLDFFFRHYSPWVDQFFIFDDGSSDGTLEYLRARSDVQVGRTPHSDPESWVASARDIYNTNWKQSRGLADWVVVTNIDEHLHHPDMRGYLERQLAAGATIIPALGYQMISDDFPTPGSLLHRDYPMGAPWQNMNRIGIFRPDRISETNFTPGRHKAMPEGDIARPAQHEVANLHYKYLGLSRTHARHQAQSERLGSGDREKGWGHKYDWKIDQLDADIDRFRAQQRDTRNTDHETEHGEPRWWSRQHWKTVDQT